MTSTTSASMSTATVGDHRLAYRDTGDGEPVVLVHGGFAAERFRSDGRGPHLGEGRLAGLTAHQPARGGGVATLDAPRTRDAAPEQRLDALSKCRFQRQCGGPSRPCRAGRPSRNAAPPYGFNITPTLARHQVNGTPPRSK